MPAPLRRPHWPLLLIMVSVVLQAIVQGTLTSTIRPQDSLLFTAVSFVLTTVVFVPADLWRRHRRWEARIPQDAEESPGQTIRTLMILMNAATAVTFLSFYLAISLIPAATASALETAFGPSALIVLGLLFLHGAEKSAGRQKLSTVVLAGLGCVLAWHTWNPEGSEGNVLVATAGVALSVLAGIGMAALTLLSRACGRRGISPVTVTAHRFHLTYVLALTLWLTTSPSAPRAEQLGTFAVLGLIAVTVPLFLLQVGLQRADPLTGIAIIVTLPGLTYFVQIARGEPADPVTLVLLTAIIATAAVGMRPNVSASKSGR